MIEEDIPCCPLSCLCLLSVGTKGVCHHCQASSPVLQKGGLHSVPKDGLAGSVNQRKRMPFEVGLAVRAGFIRALLKLEGKG